MESTVQREESKAHSPPSAGLNHLLAGVSCVEWRRQQHKHSGHSRQVAENVLSAAEDCSGSEDPTRSLL